MKPSKAVASFDSATGMIRALSRQLSGRDVPLLGQLPRKLELPASTLLGTVNHLPARQAEALYAASGVAEAVPPHAMGDIDSEQLARWIVDHYPKRQYGTILLGSSNGAAVHLAAALDAPWLPQTLLVPVRRNTEDRDDAGAELRAGAQPGEALLQANPDLVLHHMHDPNQDRLMIRGMSYFRVKWQRLPTAYREFLQEALAPGGVVLSVECETQWPVTQVADRHYFQFGAVGGATVEEYREGSSRVSAFLRRYGSAWNAWEPPQTDQLRPEAEWGFEPAWQEDVTDQVRARSAHFRRLRFTIPDDLSPAVADVYRHWNHQGRGIPNERLLFDSFLLMDPWWTIRTGSVPFWLSFATEGSLQAAHEYLDRTGTFDELRLMLFSHGTDSIGLAAFGEWQQLLQRARKIGTALGADRRAFPRDFAVLARAHRALAQMRHLHPMPQPLPWNDVETLLQDRTDIRLITS